MKTAILVFSILFASQAFAKQATAIDCQKQDEQQVMTFQVADLRDCSDIKANSVCDYIVGNDRFTAWAFDKTVLGNSLVGDRIAGSLLRGYVYKDWVVDSEEPLSCTIR